MSVGKPVAAGVHVDLERQRLLGTSDAEPVRGAGASDVPSASASEMRVTRRAPLALVGGSLQGCEASLNRKVARVFNRSVCIPAFRLHSVFKVSFKGNYQ